MESMSKNSSTESMQEPKSTKGKSKVANVVKGGMKRKLGVLDLILRIGAAVSTMAAAVIMGTLDVHLPFFTQFVQFEAQYNDLPPFQFFMFANGIACGFIVIVSLPLSIVCILRPYTAVRVRLFLVIFDTVVLTLVTSAAAAGADIVYLAHNGNSNTNWQAFCNQYTDFCQNSSSAVIASFIGVGFIIFLVTVSAISLRRKT
ncbi:hypothetical protein Leryth_008680 [Lithospermum erythrorhizon]|nr:hypothetical protein Leryth_008680 [Lithospermum erythrorhizon]